MITTKKILKNFTIEVDRGEVTTYIVKANPIIKKSKFKIMKKLLFLSILFISIAAHSQPYVSVMATTQGVGFSTGIVCQSGVDLSIGYNAPISTKAYIPSIFYFKGGYEYLLSNKEENNYSVTPTFGMAYWMKKDFTEWNKGGEVKSMQDLKLILSVEVGKDINAGRIFINGTYCGNLYAGIGIRGFIK